MAEKRKANLASIDTGNSAGPRNGKVVLTNANFDLGSAQHEMPVMSFYDETSVRGNSIAGTPLLFSCKKK